MKTDVELTDDSQIRIKELEIELQQRNELLIEIMARNHDLRILLMELTEGKQSGKSRISE